MVNARDGFFAFSEPLNVCVCIEGGGEGGGSGVLPPTTRLSAEAGVEPIALRTLNASLIVEPTSAAWTAYVDWFVRYVHDAPAESQRSHCSPLTARPLVPVQPPMP